MILPPLYFDCYNLGSLVILPPHHSDKSAHLYSCSSAYIHACKCIYIHCVWDIRPTKPQRFSKWRSTEMCLMP